MSSSYSRPSYAEQWNQNNYNPYQNWNQNQNTWGKNQYQQNGGQYGSSYGRVSSYSPPPSFAPPKSPYGRPEYSYSPYSRPTSSYGRPPQMYPAEPSPALPPVPPVVSQPFFPPTPENPETLATPVPVSVPGPVAPTNIVPSTSPPLFGGVEPGAGSLSPGIVPPLPPTDEEQIRVDAAEKENEVSNIPKVCQNRKSNVQVRKARGGPPGINVDAIAETGTLPPQAAVPEIPMPPLR